MPTSTPPVPRLLAAAAVALATGALPLGAQYSSVPEPAAYALRGVTVVGADGKRTSGVTIVVRNGLIEAMGPAATVPAGAMLLEGDSLLVYPGLVDAHGAAKFAFPEPQLDRAQIRSWDPPRAAQGFFPHRRVADVLQATGRDLADQRRSGVVAAAVMPEPSIVAGQGTVLMLRPGATVPSELVVTPSVGTLLALRGGRGVYPSTMFATTAFLRQTFEDARHARAVRAAWERDPRGMTTPAADPDHQVVQGIMSGEQRAFFLANTAAEIRYALDLGEQYGFEPVIVGGMEAHRVADRLRAKDVPVLVSLDFGTPRRWKPSDDAPATVGERTDSAQKVPAGREAPDAAVLREQREFEARYANAGRLARAGVRFALTSGGGKAKLLDGARTAIRHGLPEEAALRALTATPAEILGMPRLATVAQGQPATFVVASGPLFDRGTRVLYTFVEGAMERGASPASTARPAPTAAAGAAPAAPATPAGAGAGAVAGRYDVELASAQGTLTGVMTLSGDASAFSGSIDTEAGAIQVRGGRLAGEAMTFTLVLPFAGNMEIPVRATMQGGSFDATVSTPMGEARISGRRADPRDLEREAEPDDHQPRGGHHHPSPAGPETH